MYSEVPNLPMHLRLLLKDCGYRHTKLYELIELTYFRIIVCHILVLFVIFRGAMAIPLLIYVWKDVNSSIIIKLVGAILVL